MKRYIARACSIVAVVMAAILVIQSVESFGQDRPRPGEQEQKQQQDVTKGQRFQGRVVDLARHLTGKAGSPGAVSPLRDSGLRERGQERPDRPASPGATPQGQERAAGPQGRQATRQLAEDLPIGLLMQGQSPTAQQSRSQPLYLVIYDPDEQEQKRAYQSMRRMVGQQVEARGRKVERDGIQAIIIEEVNTTRSAQRGAGE